MTVTPGADEQRIRHFLRDLGAAPAGTNDDWWSALYPNEPTGADDASTEASPDGPDSSPEESGWVRTLLRKAAADPDDKTMSSTDADPDRPDEAADAPEWTEATDPDDPAERTPGRPVAARTASRRATAAYLTLAPRTRVLLYNGAAAGLGYGLGLVPLTKGWITSCGHDTGNVTAAVLLGVGMVVVAGIADRRTRHWWPPLAWACRVPLASVLLALALYAPGTI